jgi:phosphopantetheinyl transferase
MYLKIGKNEQPNPEQRSLQILRIWALKDSLLKSTGSYTRIIPTRENDSDG